MNWKRPNCRRIPTLCTEKNTCVMLDIGRKFELSRQELLMHADGPVNSADAEDDSTDLKQRM